MGKLQQNHHTFLHKFQTSEKAIVNSWTAYNGSLLEKSFDWKVLISTAHFSLNINKLFLCQ